MENLITLAGSVFIEIRKATWRVIFNEAAYIIQRAEYDQISNKFSKQSPLHCVIM